MFLIVGVELWLFAPSPTGDTRYRRERVPAASMWTRIRPLESRRREARGERF